MEWIITNIGVVLGILAKLVAAAAAIAAITPTASDNRIIGFLVQIVDIVGLNVLNAKNEGR